MRLNATEILRPISLTGFTDLLGMAQAHAAFDEYVPGGDILASTSPLFRTGILVSSATLDGRPNPKPHRYPPLDLLEELFYPGDKMPDCSLFCHYCSEDGSRMVEDCQRIDSIVGGGMHGLQINLTWPNVDDMRRLRAILPNHTIILQVGKEALDVYARDFGGHMNGYHSRELVAHIETYDGLINGVLLDPSGGRGIDLIPNHFLSILTGLQSTTLEVSVAGNLSSETIPGLRALRSAHASFGIDIESAIRTTDDHEIDIAKVVSCLQAAQNLFYA